MSDAPDTQAGSVATASISPEAVADVLRALLEAAFASGPAFEANALIAGVRQEHVAMYGQGHNYEVSLLGADWADIAHDVARRFRDYLHDKGFSRLGADPVFVSLFEGDRLYFIRSSDVVELTRPLVRPATLAALPAPNDPALPVPVEPDSDEA